MDPPQAPSSSARAEAKQRSLSTSSQKSDDSHTAAEFIDSQLRLEADAREALPYSIENCTRPLGSLRQILFACLTCNPPPVNTTDPYTPAGICYSCSVQCHGEHTLVELFNKRNFTCDCGTTRLPVTAPCTLRINQETGMKGNVHSEVPEANNKYNQNFKNKFCGCQLDYDPFMQKGTMFQCLGLGTTETGGCGEDWWHPGCIVGLGSNWHETASEKGTAQKLKKDSVLPSIVEVAEVSVDDPGSTEQVDSKPAEEIAAPVSSEAQGDGEDDEDEIPLPPGFPDEDDFEGFICYKCVDSNPWIKRYAGTSGFLAPVFYRSAAPSPEVEVPAKAQISNEDQVSNLKKRKTVDDDDANSPTHAKRVKEDGENSAETKVQQVALSTATLAGSPTTGKSCKINKLSPSPSGRFSLFFKSDFRDHLCRCSDCFHNLADHPQLLEEEETYEPPVSEDGDEAGGSTIGSGSIYDRGESALKNVDRVRAIEGVMAYNHLKDKLKPFFQQFAESGKAISAEDIKAHFAKMRGDEQAIKEAGEGAKVSDHRKEQGGY
ncbi:putative zinc finger in N-recognin-domain-containing protein [Bisporella sp. PMI_857]|nr:putative zinc finger in N-recognin-domain-containing protein [Bisporella sp. PMI_857]